MNSEHEKRGSVTAHNSKQPHKAHHFIQNEYAFITCSYYLARRRDVQKDMVTEIDIFLYQGNHLEVVGNDVLYAPYYSHGCLQNITR